MIRVPDFLRTTVFRLAASFAVMFSVSVILLFAFIYWQTETRETERIDRFLVADAALIAGQTRSQIEQAVSLRNLGDLHRITFAVLFNADGRLLIGNLAALPSDLPIDGRAHALDTVSVETGTFGLGAARAVGRRLPSGNILVVGRNVDALNTLGGIVLSGLGTRRDSGPAPFHCGRRLRQLAGAATGEVGPPIGRTDSIRRLAGTATGARHGRRFRPAGARCQFDA